MDCELTFLGGSVPVITFVSGFLSSLSFISLFFLFLYFSVSLFLSVSVCFYIVCVNGKNLECRTLIESQYNISANYTERSKFTLSPLIALSLLFTLS